MTYRHYGAALRDWRGERTQTEAATALGMSQGQLSRLEHGYRRPSVALLWRMAEVYQRNQADILPVARLLADAECVEEEE